MIYNLLHSILGETPNRLFLRVFPPYAEKNMLAINIGLGLVFTVDSTKLLVISTQEDDAWSPHVSYQGIPEYIFEFSQFTSRMKGWMDGKELGSLDYEYYEVTQESLFRHIVAHKILSIQLIKIKSLADPLGIKLLFSHDYIILSPIADGSTVETKYFSLGNNLAIFRKIGKLEFLDLQSVSHKSIQ